MEEEYFFEIASEEFFIGRVAIFATQVNAISDEDEAGRKFHAEVDIINKESRKIYRHVKSLFGFSDAREARNEGIQVLSQYLRNSPVH
jgi:hypothetical protein